MMGTALPSADPGCFAPQELGSLVISLLRLIGLDREGIGRNVGRLTVGIVAIEIGFRRLVLPVDLRLGRPVARVGEAHIVNVVARRLEGSGGCTLVVNHIDTYLVSGFISRIRHSRPDIHRNVDGVSPDRASESGSDQPYRFPKNRKPGTKVPRERGKNVS